LSIFQTLNELLISTSGIDRAKAGHTLKRGRHTAWRGKQANLAYKISLGYFILRFGIITNYSKEVFYQKYD
jgi:hypothetical protein